MVVTEQPLVSIIMPAHNSERYIKQAIESVKKQIYSNWELLIVDDCSTDETPAIISEYSMDPRIKPIYLQENIGIAGARNKAIEQSKGKYIAFLDSDDTWMNNKLDYQVKYMIRTGCVFTYTYYRVINENNQVVRLINHVPQELTYSDLLKSNSIGLLTAVIESEILKTTRMPNIPHEDYAAWLNILHKGYTAKLVTSILANYRIQSNSRSSNKIKSMFWTWRIYRKNQHKNILLSVYYLTCYIFWGVRKHI